jgi:hypothetical protein
MKTASLLPSLFMVWITVSCSSSLLAKSWKLRGMCTLVESFGPIVTYLYVVSRRATCPTDGDEGTATAVRDEVLVVIAE